MDLSDIDIDYILFRLENDYPSGYDYKILRAAASLIKFYREDNND
jgi:hypothetical protein